MISFGCNNIFSMKKQRIIAHVDMDAFFAAIEERDNPRYRRMPIVVGADPKAGMGRGVVSTANYTARMYGIHSAMPISSAWKLSLQAASRGSAETVFLPVDMPKYVKTSHEVMTILREHVDTIEQTSIDEAYLDLSFTNDFNKAKKLISRLKEEIKKKQLLTTSVGVGPNKLIAKLASAKNKPNGLTVVKPKEIEEFMDNLALRDIPGIGPKTEEKLQRQRIFTIRELKKASHNDLLLWFGKWGTDIYEKVRGVDNSLLQTSRQAKSVSEQETFDSDTRSASFLMDKILQLAGKVHERLADENIKSFRTITITVRFHDFETKNRSHTLKSASSDCQTLKQEALKLFLPFLNTRQNPKHKPVRLLGVGIENLETMD